MFCPACHRSTIDLCGSNFGLGTLLRLTEKCVKSGEIKRRPPLLTNSATRQPPCLRLRSSGLSHSSATPLAALRLVVVLQAAFSQVSELSDSNLSAPLYHRRHQHRRRRDTTTSRSLLQCAQYSSNKHSSKHTFNNFPTENPSACLASHLAILASCLGEHGTYRCSFTRTKCFSPVADACKNCRLWVISWSAIRSIHKSTWLCNTAHVSPLSFRSSLSSFT